jgi:predicted XRE-type DNA-binding protein
VYQLERVQRGLEPDDWKPMNSIGLGVREIRVRDRSGAYHVSGCDLCPPCVPKEDTEDVNEGPELGGVASQGPEAEQTMKEQRFDSVWDALEASPAAAANMKARAELMVALTETIEAWGASQASSAKRLGVTQPRLNDLLRGRITKFSLDALMKLAGRAGLAVRLQIMRPAA